MIVNGSVQNTYNNVTDESGYAIPPQAAGLEIGQIAVNTSDTDPSIFFKTSTGVIAKIPTEAVLVRVLTDILGNSAADLDTLRELIAQFEGSANDILPLITTLTNKVSALETASQGFSAHMSSRTNPHEVTKTQVGLSAVLNKEQLGKTETAVNTERVINLMYKNVGIKPNPNSYTYMFTYSDNSNGNSGGCTVRHETDSMSAIITFGIKTSGSGDVANHVYALNYLSGDSKGSFYVVRVGAASHFYYKTGGNLEYSARFIISEGSYVTYIDPNISDFSTATILEKNILWTAKNNLVTFPYDSNLNNIPKNVWGSVQIGNKYTEVNAPSTYVQVFNLAGSGTTSGNLQLASYYGDEENYWLRGYKDTGVYKTWRLLYHSGNFNNTDTDMYCKTLSANSFITTPKTRLIQDTNAGYLQFGDGTQKVGIISARSAATLESLTIKSAETVISGSLKAANMFIGSDQVYHAGNLNRSDVPFTASVVYAADYRGSRVSGSITRIIGSHGVGTDAVGGRLQFLSGQGTGNAGGGDMEFYTPVRGSASGTVASGTVLRIRIKENTGYVGINIGEPTERLHVGGNTIIEGNFKAAKGGIVLAEDNKSTYIDMSGSDGSRKTIIRSYTSGGYQAEFLAGGIKVAGDGAFNGNLTAIGDIIARKTNAIVFTVSDAAGGGATRLNDLTDIKIPDGIRERMVLYYDPAQINSDGTKGGYTFDKAVGVTTGRVTAQDIDSLPDIKLIDRKYPSDRNLKENFSNFDANMLLGSLEPKCFTWNANARQFGFEGQAYGLIAQDVKDVLPNAIVNLGVDNYIGVDYIQIIPILIKGYQDLHSKIVNLNLRLNGSTRR